MEQNCLFAQLMIDLHLCFRRSLVFGCGGSIVSIPLPSIFTLYVDKPVLDVLALSYPASVL